MVQTAFEEAPNALNDDPDYRPMSGLAVAALLVGMCSAAAFFSSFLWAVPVLGIALAVAALLQIRNTAPPRAGKAVASVGMALSLFCLAGAIGYDVSYNWVLQRQAGRVVQRCIDALLNNDLKVAHQLSLPPERRAARVDQLAVLYERDGFLADELETYSSSDAIQRVLEVEDREFVLHDTSSPEFTKRHQRVAYVYRVRSKQRAESEGFLLRFDLVRDKPSAHSIAGWQIRALRPVDENYKPE